MIVLIIIAMAVLALEISSESTLAQEVKSMLGLGFNPPKWILSFSKISFWNKLFSKYLFPLNLTFAFFFSIYKKLNELVNCPFCLSFHLTLWTSYLYLDNNLFYSILYGLITIPITHLIQKIYE